MQVTFNPKPDSLVALAATSLEISIKSKRLKSPASHAMRTRKDTSEFSPLSTKAHASARTVPLSMHSAGSSSKGCSCYVVQATIIETTDSARCGPEVAHLSRECASNSLVSTRVIIVVIAGL